MKMGRGVMYSLGRGLDMLCGIRQSCKKLTKTFNFTVFVTCTTWGGGGGGGERERECE